jgi:hypothetical protein
VEREQEREGFVERWAEIFSTASDPRNSVLDRSGEGMVKKR